MKYCFRTIANFYKSFLVHTPANRATVVKAKSVRTTIVETTAMAALRTNVIKTVTTPNTSTGVGITVGTAVRTTIRATV